MPRRFALALMVSVLAAACSEATNSTGMISKRIGETARLPGSTEVDLGKLTTFGWDRVYAFKPGTTRDEMCKFLGANRNVCGRVIRLEQTPEAHIAMVYDLRGQVTHFEFHALENGRFDVSFGEHGIPRTSAVFRVRRSTGTNEIWLETK
jgi:hypothetical protein